MYVDIRKYEEGCYFRSRNLSLPTTPSLSLSCSALRVSLFFSRSLTLSLSYPLYTLFYTLCTYSEFNVHRILCVWKCMNAGVFYFGYSIVYKYKRKIVWKTLFLKNNLQIHEEKLKARNEWRHERLLFTTNKV